MSYFRYRREHCGTQNYWINVFDIEEAKCYVKDVNVVEILTGNPEDDELMSSGC